MEMADIAVVNKADGDLKKSARKYSIFIILESRATASHSLLLLRAKKDDNWRHCIIRWAYSDPSIARGDPKPLPRQH